MRYGLFFKQAFIFLDCRTVRHSCPSKKGCFVVPVTNNIVVFFSPQMPSMLAVAPSKVLKKAPHRRVTGVSEGPLHVGVKPGKSQRYIALD